MFHDSMYHLAWIIVYWYWVACLPPPVPQILPLRLSSVPGIQPLSSHAAALYSSVYYEGTRVACDSDVVDLFLCVFTAGYVGVLAADLAFLPDPRPWKCYETRTFTLQKTLTLLLPES